MPFKVGLSQKWITNVFEEILGILFASGLGDEQFGQCLIVSQGKGGRLDGHNAALDDGVVLDKFLELKSDGLLELLHVAFDVRTCEEYGGGLVLPVASARRIKEKCQISLPVATLFGDHVLEKREEKTTQYAGE